MSDVTIATDVDLPENMGITISGDLTLDEATMSLSSDTSSGGSSLHFTDRSSNQSLLGNGTIRFAGGRINSINSQEYLTIDQGITLEVAAGTGRIRGQQVISKGLLHVQTGSQFLLETDDYTNQGVIDVAGTLTIGRSKTSIWRNEGTIRLEEGASLTLFGTFTTEDLGTLEDEGASQVVLAGILDNTDKTLDLDTLNLSVPLSLNGGELRGGVITSSGGGGSLGFFGGTNAIFDGLTLATHVLLDAVNGTPCVFVYNGLTLHDSVLTVPEGATLSFTGSDPQTLDGNGTVLANNRPLTSGTTNIAGSQLTIGENITIRNGIEAYRELSLGFLENKGTIIVEAPSSVVTIGNGSTIWTNNGTIQVKDGTLELNGVYSVDDIGNLEYSGGIIELRGNLLNEGKAFIQDFSTGVWRLRAHIDDGRVEINDGLEADLGGTFDSVTFAGKGVLGTNSNTSTGSLAIRNQLTLDDGTIVIPENSLLRIVDHPVSLTGNGKIVLNGTTSNTLIQTFNGSVLTIDQNVTIRTGPNGGGTISRSTLPVINQGTISAETALQTLLVDGALQNTGTLQALNASILRIDSDILRIDSDILRIDSDNWINEGKLLLLQSRIMINSDSFENGINGIVEGNGTILYANSPFVNKGIIAPENDSQHLNFDATLDLRTSSRLEIEIGGTGSDEFDFIRVLQDASIDGVLNISLLDGFLFKASQEFVILSIARKATGEFIGLPDQSLVGNFKGIDLYISYFAGDGNDVALFTQVPEPFSEALILIALIAFVNKYRSVQ